MNRAKVWVFTLLVVAAGGLVAYAAASARRSDAVSAIDARLASAAAHVTASIGAVGREANAVAALVARDDALLAALRPRESAPAPAPAAKGKKPTSAPAPAPAAPDPIADEGRVRDAAHAALDRAGQALGLDLPKATLVYATTRDALARGGDAPGGENDPPALLRGAAAGQPRRSVVRQGGMLWYAAARPAGDGAAVMVLVPLEEAWARRVAGASGADVTLAVPEVRPLTTGRPTEVPIIQSATKLAGAGDVGRPTGVEVSVGPVKLPKLPQPLPGGAPLRARPVPLEGLKGGYAIVSIPAAAAVNAPAAFLWLAAGGLVLVLLAGLAVGLLVGAEQKPQLPDALVSAAARIEKGDFAARAPQLAGKLGTIAAALNRAAELAGPAAAVVAAPPATEERILAPVRAAEEPRLATAVGMAAAGPTRTATVAAVAAPVTGTFELDEESHWQQIFQEFLRVRASCGESTEGLTYEKFRGKLEANKAQLVAKYACRTVRFQVYVKEGKTALKATPVK